MPKGHSNDNDPFLSHTAGPTAATKKKSQFNATWQKHQRKDVGRDCCEGCALVLLPCLEFLLITSLFLFLHSSFYLVTWLCVSLCLIGAAGMLVVSHRQLESSGDMGWYYVLSVSLLVALGLAVLLGHFSYVHYMREYSWMTTGRHYTNMTAVTPAAARSDASWLHFKNDSYVDTSRSVGFRQGVAYGTGSTFCAAPVMSVTNKEAVEYWAIGIDCCLKRATFTCDDATTPGAFSAIVVPGSVLPGVGWMGQDLLPFYRAVKMAEATYDLASANRPLLIRWVSDPKAVQATLWRNGTMVLWAGTLAELLIAIILACCLPQKRQNKNEFHMENQQYKTKPNQLISKAV